MSASWARRFLLALGLVVGVLAWVTPSSVWADPPPEGQPAPVEAAPAEGDAPADGAPAGKEEAGGAPKGDEAAAGTDGKKRLTMQQLEQRIGNLGAGLIVILLLRFLPLIAGLVLIVLWFVRRSEVRSGLRPAPPVTSPPMVFDQLQSYLLPILAMAFMPMLLGAVLVAAQDVDRLPTLQSIAVMFVCTVPLAIVVVMRHRRISQPSPPAIGKGLVIGLWAFCVAQLVAVPISAGWLFFLKLQDYAPQVQQLVQHVVEAPKINEPLAIALFGIFVAPFAEEALFRGTIYPALRNAFGGEPGADSDGRATSPSRSGVWIGIIVTSLLFAAVHGELTALVPLFCLAVVLNLVYEKTNSLGACIFAHAVFNASSLIPLFLLRGAA